MPASAFRRRSPLALLAALLIAGCSRSATPAPISGRLAVGDSQLRQVAELCSAGIDVNELRSRTDSSSYGCPPAAVGRAADVCSDMGGIDISYARYPLTASPTIDWSDQWVRMSIDCDWSAPSGVDESVDLDVAFAGSPANPRQKCSQMPGVPACKGGTHGSIGYGGTVPGAMAPVVQLNTAGWALTVEGDLMDPRAVLDQVVPRTGLAISTDQAIG